MTELIDMITSNMYFEKALYKGYKVEFGLSKNSIEVAFTNIGHNREKCRIGLEDSNEAITFALHDIYVRVGGDGN